MSSPSLSLVPFLGEKESSLLVFYLFFLSNKEIKRTYPSEYVLFGFFFFFSQEMGV